MTVLTAYIVLLVDTYAHNRGTKIAIKYGCPKAFPCQWTPKISPSDEFSAKRGLIKWLGVSLDFSHQLSWRLHKQVVLHPLAPLTMVSRRDTLSARRKSRASRQGNQGRCAHWTAAQLSDLIFHRASRHQKTGTTKNPKKRADSKKQREQTESLISPNDKGTYTIILCSL